jgi:SAM-dependent methyltransferase
MSIILNDAQLAAAREALLGDGSDALIDLLFRLNLRLSSLDVAEQVWGHAVELGWVNASTRRLTDLGHLVADPLREYQFWLGRERRLHAELDHPHLVASNYENKVVVELGSGFGCNLFSLSRFSGTFSGVEPVALYRQFTSILAEREGLKCPVVMGGCAEAIPVESESADVVLCYSAHQYMDVRVALQEMARILKPGGQMQIIGGTLGKYFVEGVREFYVRRRLSGASAYILTIVNTLSYCGLGRRAIIPRGYASTTAPVYPPVAVMQRWMERCGLVFRTDLSRRIPSEMCFIADKPLRNRG